MSNQCQKCRNRRLKKENKRLRDAVTALFRACEAVASDLGNAEWATAEDGEEILKNIIHLRHDRLKGAMVKAARKEAMP